jgi:hypothetical protein
MADSSVAVTPGSGANIDTITAPNGDHRQVVISDNKGGYSGHVSTFRTPGRAGTTGQKIFSIHNATGSTIAVDIHKLIVGHSQTVVTAVTVIPPIIRLWKVTVLPTNGTALTKVADDTGGTATSSSVTVLGDASADGTGSGTTLTATLPAGTVVAEAFAPLLVTAVGQVASNQIAFLTDSLETITLRALEGLVVFLDYTNASANATTDSWTVNCAWEEYLP